LKGDVVGLLSELIRVPSVSDPDKGVLVGRREAVEIAGILEEHSGLGMDVRIDGGAPVLLAVRGEGRPVTLFMAHFDVVPPGPGWSVTQPLEPRIVDGRLYGRGAADDKGNVAAISLALSGFQPREGTVVVAFTGDEEVGGRRGAGWLASWLRSEGLWPDYLVNGDGAFSRVIVRRRNVFVARIRVRGELWEVEGARRRASYTAEFRVRATRHAAYFLPGVDRHPLIEASLEARDRGLYAVSLRGEWVKSNVVPSSVEVEWLEPGAGEERVQVDLGLTWLVHAILPLTRLKVEGTGYSDYGVTATPNVYRRTPAGHEIQLDVRAMCDEKRRVEEAIEEILEHSLPGEAEWSITVEAGGGTLYTSPHARLVRIATRINRSLGLPGDTMEAAGASDSRYFSPHGVEAIDYGPRGAGVHGPDEYVEVEALGKAVEFYRRVAEELHSGAGGQ